MNQLQSFFGIIIFLGVVFLFSKSKKEISYRLVGTGLILQLLTAIILLKLPIVSTFFLKINGAVAILQNVTNRSAQFMFGFLAGGQTPFEVTNPNHSFIVAFQVLPLILVIGALSALLFHFGILTWVINQFSKILRRFFPISGALGFGAASTLFLGTIEAPLAIRPYLSKLSRAEMLGLIVCSMSTIAGTVIVLYASVLEKTVPGALTHLLTASLISIPAALTVSHIFMPSTESGPDIQLDPTNLTWVEALLDSVKDGVQMIISIIAIIIILFAFIYLADECIEVLNPDWSVGYLLGQILRPVMWLVGFSWESAAVAAELMGTKIVLNEFVAYLNLGQVTNFTPKETLLAVYSLCGFANFASCGIIIAGLSSLLPERRTEIVSLTFWSLLLGNIVTLITGCVVNIVSF